MEKYLVKTVNNIEADASGNVDGTALGFIPLTGTEVGKPVTGDIELLHDGNWKKIYSKNVDGKEFGLIISTEEDLVYIYQKQEDGNTMYNRFGGNTIDDFAVFGSGYRPIVINGILGISAETEDFSEVEPENKLIYAQRSYVDTKLSRKIFNINMPTIADNIPNVDYVYNISGGVTLILSTAVGNTNEYKIKNVDTIPCDIVADGIETIDGLSLFTLIYQYDSITLISNGTN